MRFSSIVFGALTFVIVLTYSLSRLNTSSEEVEIGALLCLSGSCAEWGESARAGIELAIEEQNQKGGLLGKKIRLRLEDSAESTSGAKAVSGYRRLRQDKLRFIIGPSWTPAGLSLAPIAAKNPDIILISPSLGVPDFNRYSKNLLNTWPHDEVGTRLLAQYAISLENERISVLSSEQAWEEQQGKIFIEEVKKRKGRILSHLKTSANAQELKGEITRLLRADPQVVFLSNFNSLASAAIELKRQGFAGVILCALLDKTRIESAHGALEGAVTTQYPAASKSFSKRFRSKFNRDPGIASASAYDAAKSYFLAVEFKRNTNSEQVLRSLLDTPRPGASGSIRFDSSGSLMRTPNLAMVKENLIVSASIGIGSSSSL